MLSYITCYGTLYNTLCGVISHVMLCLLYNTCCLCYVMFYNMSCYIMLPVMLCYITYYFYFI